jgi:hypothetical protein
MADNVTAAINNSSFWQFDLATIIAIAVASITAIGVFWGPILGAKKQRQKEALRNHFIDMETHMIKPLIDTARGLYCSGGLILDIDSISENPLEWTIDLNSDNALSSFTSHFPDQMENYAGIIDGIQQHNKSIIEFQDRIEQRIQKETGMPVERNGTRPFIWPNTLNVIRDRLFKLVNDEESSIGKYTNAQVIQTTYAWQFIESSQMYAEANTEAEINKIASSFWAMLADDKLLEETSERNDNAKALLRNVTMTANALELICTKYSKLNSYLKKEKNCAYCDIIYRN